VIFVRKLTDWGFKAYLLHWRRFLLLLPLFGE
jgi:hypothetical protein